MVGSAFAPVYAYPAYRASVYAAPVTMYAAPPPPVYWYYCRSLGAYYPVAGEAEVDDVLLAALHRHGYAAGLRLEMVKRRPPPGGVPQASPKRGRGDPVLTERERPDPLGRRHRREKSSIACR
jgi:hypothetical protein